MLTLALRDMVRSARVWVGALLIVAVAAFVGIVPATLIESGLRDGTLPGLGLVAIAGTVIVLTLIATTVVLGATLRLTVALRRRSYALWQTVGVSPARVGATVLAQLFIVALVGAVLGGVVGAGVLPGLAETALQGSSGVESLHLAVSPTSGVVVVTVVAVIAVAIGAASARRAARTRPLEVLRETPPAQRPRRWPRWLVASVAVAIAAQMLTGLGASAAAGSGSAAILIGPILTAACAALGPILFPPVMRGWTKLIPARASASWYVARANTLFAVDRSSSVVASLLVAIALPGSFAAGQGTLAGALGIIENTDSPVGSAGALLLILGGPVLLAAAGAAASTVMSSGERSRENALLTAAGAPAGFALLTAVWEAVIQIGTALLLAAAVVIVSATTEAFALSGVAPGTVPYLALDTVGATFALTALAILLASVVPTLVGRRQAVPAALNEQ